MDGEPSKGRRPHDAVLPPGLPGWPGLQGILLAALAVLVVADEVFWHGLLFRSRIWHGFLWGLVPVGLAIGGFAYWRRER